MKSADRTDILIIAATVFALLLSAGLLVFGVLHADDIDEQRTDALPGIGTAYAEQFFDDSFVHTVNLIIPEQNWAYMVGHAAEEEYVPCDAEIDGEFIADIALRPKGNSSLSSIALQGSEHFSFKIEFDHYRAGNTFHGLDKLSLSNLGSDPTCMKETTWGKNGIRKVFMTHVTEDQTQPILQVMKAKAALDARKDKEQMADTTYQNELKKIKAGEIDGQKIQTMTIIIKATNKATYKNVIDALDEMQICSVGKYVLDKISPDDAKLLKSKGISVD